MRLLFIACVAAVAGCGDDTGSGTPAAAELSCEYLSDPGNCWATAAAAAAACLPASEVGVLADDRASCTFSDGTRIVFDEALPSALEELERLAFTIEKGGASCARFVDTFENRLELTAGSHAVVAQLRGDFELQCGDGTTYATEFDSLFDCQPGTQPTDGFDVTAEYVSFSIVSVATPGELFRCEVPAAMP